MLLSYCCGITLECIDTISKIQASMACIGCQHIWHWIKTRISGSEMIHFLNVNLLNSEIRHNHLISLYMHIVSNTAEFRFFFAVERIFYKMSLIIKKFEIYILLCITSASSLNLGDVCTVTASNESGICRFVEDCPIIKTKLNEQSVIPTFCGLEGNVATFCCPQGTSVLNTVSSTSNSNSLLPF